MSTLKDYKLELTDFEQVALEKKIKQRDFEIAKKLKNKGIDLKDISEATGLSIEENLNHKYFWIKNVKCVKSENLA